jgi:YHS domain-containing protein
MSEEHEVTVGDHLEKDEEITCGYCGRVFSSHELRVEKEIYGKKWIFCDENCLEDFRDASDFKDENPDKHHPEDYDEITPEMSVTITGPPQD